MLPGLCVITHTCSLLSVILHLIKYNFFGANKNYMQGEVVGFWLIEEMVM